MITETAVFGLLKEVLGAALLETRGAGDSADAVVTPSRVRDALLALRDRLGFNVLVDLTGADLSKLPEPTPSPRFEVTYRLAAVDAATGLLGGRFALKCRVADGEPGPASVMDLWPAADWLEREVWDMFGVKPSDRPDLRRLLLYQEFVGHPLRKDYDIKRRQPLLTPRFTPERKAMSPEDLRPRLVE